MGIPRGGDESRGFCARAAANPSRSAQDTEARKTIDRAKGVLMDRHGKTEQEAWRFPQQQAMQNRVKVHDIARRVVDGELSP